MENAKIRAVIIDDDPFIRDLLEDKLQQYIPEVELLGTASSGTEGLELIDRVKPALVFLDVEMADMTGFEMLSRIERIDFLTIFITSYSHYAIKAIRFNALDYLVKPIDLGELKKAIARYKDRIGSIAPAEYMQHALNNIHLAKKEDQELTLQTQEGTLYLSVKDIIRIEGERNYSYIFLSGGKKKLLSKTIGDFEDLLSDRGFFRAHKSHLINRLHVAGNQNKFAVLLSDGTEVPIARRRKEEFEAWLIPN